MEAKRGMIKTNINNILVRSDSLMNMDMLVLTNII